MQGGNFGHGFFSAGVTKGAGGAWLPGGGDLGAGDVAYGTVVSAVIGGTASVISGGKFANGAQTAAFQYLFNQIGDNYPFGKEAQDALNDLTPDYIRDMEDAAAQIRINYVKGKYSEILAAEYFVETYGAEVIIGQVTLLVDQTLRFPDLTVLYPNGTISFVEVKSGMARLNAQQVRLDRIIQSQGANIMTAPYGSFLSSGRIGPTDTDLVRVMLRGN
ncbi:hypothetical protein RHSA111115_03670 [Rheinheimera salexigens]